MAVRTLAAADLQAADAVLSAAFAGAESRVDDTRRDLAVEPEAWRAVAPIAIAPGASAAARDVLGRYGFARTGGTRHMRRGRAAARDRTRIRGQASYAVG